jgi:hypothetical protein
MLPRQHLSGAQKRNKRKRKDQFIESQKGVIHKFLTPTNIDCDPSDNLEVDITHGVEPEQNFNDEIHINEDCTGE